VSLTVPAGILTFFQMVFGVGSKFRASDSSMVPMWVSVEQATAKSWSARALSHPVRLAILTYRGLGRFSG
jgi:hypothetical protein